MLALGAVPRTLPVPGLFEHALSFKSLADAIHLRNHVLHQLEAADAALDEEERSRRLTFSSSRRLRRSRGARGTVRPRRGRPALLPAAACDPAPLGARRRRAADPPRHPAAARRLRRGRAPQARDRAPRRDDARVRLGGRGGARRDGARDPSEHARLDGRRRAEPPPCASGRCRWTRQGRVEVDETASRATGTSTYGRSAIARSSRTRAATGPTHRPASTPSARRAGSRRT